MKKYHVYGIGAALVDTEIEVTDQDLTAMGVEKGLMTLVDEQRQHELLQHLEGHMIYSKRASGGSAANSIIAASYFGSNTFFSGKVANDDNGHFYAKDMDNAGVTTNMNELSKGITGKCLVMITPDAERSMNTFLGASEQLSGEELDEAALAASEYLYIEGYLVTSPSGRAAAIRARDIAVKNNVKIALSFSDPGIVAHFKEGICEMLGGKIDMIFCNEDEATSFTETNDINAAIDELKRYANCFAITRGANGSIAFDGKQLIHIDPVKVKAVDTNGAGDMFAGAFLHAVSNGYDFSMAGALASHAAAEVVSDFGPRLEPNKHRVVRDRVFS